MQLLHFMLKHAALVPFSIGDVASATKKLTPSTIRLAQTPAKDQDKSGRRPANAKSNVKAE